MFIKRRAFDEIQKRLAEYRKTNYELQLENETLREFKDSHDRRKEERAMKKDINKPWTYNNKMRKERTKVGDIRKSEDTDKLEICVGIKRDNHGWVEIDWRDYETNLLETTYGQCDHSVDVYPLTVFRNRFLEAQIGEDKIRNQIKIRYAYITSLTNVKEDPFYKENLRFRILTLDNLEASHDPLEDLLTLRETALIKILGRDVCTGRIDMEGKDIYEGDIIRWYIEDRKQVYDDETVDAYTHFYEQDLTSKRDCKVIGTIYDKEGI